MAQAATSFQLLYISRLGPGCNFSVVREIVELARRTNPALGITGALLFDGERFCQLLEGGEPEVQTLMRRIEADPRHTRVELLHADVTSAGASMTRWVSGYCDAHDLDALDRLATVPASAPAPALAPAFGTTPALTAIDQFAAVLNRADIV